MSKAIKLAAKWNKADIVRYLASSHSLSDDKIDEACGYATSQQCQVLGPRMISAHMSSTRPQPGTPCVWLLFFVIVVRTHCKRGWLFGSDASRYMRTRFCINSLRRLFHSSNYICALEPFTGPTHTVHTHSVHTRTSTLSNLCPKGFTCSDDRKKLYVMLQKLGALPK